MTADDVHKSIAQNEHRYLGRKGVKIGLYAAWCTRLPPLKVVSESPNELSVRQNCCVSSA